jgi:hypothetical protein
MKSKIDQMQAVKGGGSRKAKKTRRKNKKHK